MKRSREPESIQGLRQGAERALELGLTPAEWASSVRFVDNYLAKTAVAMGPNAQEYVRQTIFASESAQLKQDQDALDASLLAERQAAVEAESSYLEHQQRLSSLALQRRADLNAELASIRDRLADLQVDELRLGHLLAATVRRCEIVEADNAAEAKRNTGR